MSCGTTPEDLIIVLPERKRVHWIVTSETLRLTSENKKGWTVRKRRSFKEPGARAEPGKVFALPHDSLVERTKDTVYSLDSRRTLTLGRQRSCPWHLTRHHGGCLPSFNRLSHTTASYIGIRSNQKFALRVPRAGNRNPAAIILLHWRRACCTIYDSLPSE